MPFTSTLDVRRLDSRFWLLLTALLYQAPWGLITIPAGYVTDFATVPWWSRWLTPATGAWTLPAVLHDHGCDELLRRYRLRKLGVPADQLPQCLTSRQNDVLFRQAMRECGTDPIRRWLMWTAVRWAALVNPARRGGWWRDAPLVIAISVLVVALVLAPLGLVWFLAP